ncbi:MAG: methionyl-tRNA formyltransferase [Pseudomonadota bacterium]
MRIVFAGTPEFAATALDVLLDHSGAEVVAVYTQPDRPAGRGRKPRPSPVKERALAAGLPVHQPEDFRDAATRATLADLAPDLMVVAAYGLILPKAVLAIPRLGCVNIHASKLPRWRGAAPIQRAILAGDTETAVDLMRMEPGLDTGPVLAETVLPIGPRETGGELHDRLAAAGARLLADQLDALAADELTPRPQDDAGATYARRLETAEAELDWTQSAVDLDRRIRAFNPWPVARTTVAGESPLRIHAAEPLSEPADAAPGTVRAVARDGIEVATGDGVLRLTTLQTPGGRAQPVADFLNGHRELLTPGTRLGAA